MSRAGRSDGGGGGHGGAGERARLFAALTLEAPVCARLAAWAREALGGEPDARLLDAAALHLTLCFLGELPLSAAGTISAVISDVVEPARVPGGPLVLEPAAVQWLPARRPRVCAVSLRDRDGRAGALQAALSARLAEGGWYAPEHRRWLPHVTIARLGPGTRAGRPERPAPPRLGPFPATAVVLMRSWPGSRYEALARVPL